MRFLAYLLEVIRVFSRINKNPGPLGKSSSLAKEARAKQSLNAQKSPLHRMNCRSFSKKISLVIVIMLETFLGSLIRVAQAEGQASNDASTKLPATEKLSAPNIFLGPSLADWYSRAINQESAQPPDWWQNQHTYAESLLDRIPSRQTLRQRILELTSSPVIEHLEWAGDFLFYLKQENNQPAALYYRKGLGGEEHILVESGANSLLKNPLSLPSPNDTPSEQPPSQVGQILWFKPSPNGKYIAVGVVAKNNYHPLATLYILDVENKRIFGPPIPEVIYWPGSYFVNMPSWRMDSQAVFFTRVESANLIKNPPRTTDLLPETTENRALQVYMRVFQDGQPPLDDLLDVPIFGNRTQPELPLTNTAIPGVFLSPISSYGIGFVQQLDAPTLSLWVAEGTALANAQPTWKQIVTPKDKVVGFDLRGAWIYLLTYRREMGLEVWRMHLHECNWEDAEIVVPASAQSIKQLKVAQDALYVERTDGKSSKLLRLIYNHRYNKAGKAAKSVTNSRLSGPAKLKKENPTTKMQKKKRVKAKSVSSIPLDSSVYWHIAGSNPPFLKTNTSPDKEGGFTKVTNNHDNQSSAKTKAPKKTSKPQKKLGHDKTHSNNPSKTATTSAESKVKGSKKSKANRGHRPPTRNMPPPVAGRVAEQEINLPFEGDITELITDPVQSGVFLRLASWKEPTQYLKVHGKTGAIQPVLWKAPSLAAYKTIAVTNELVQTTDGTSIVLQVLSRKGNKPNLATPTILTIPKPEINSLSLLSSEKAYSPSVLAWLEQGGIYAVCQVRSEETALGSDHPALNISPTKIKQDMDLIDCAQHLLEAGYTAPGHLGGWGDGASAALVDRVAAVRPGLFKALVLESNPYLSNDFHNTTKFFPLGAFNKAPTSNSDKQQPIILYATTRNTSLADFYAFLNWQLR